MTVTKKIFLLVDKFFFKAQNPPKLTAEAEKGLHIERDIPFSDNYPDQKTDILFKERQDGEKYPVVFHIHGGGFSAGDKEYRNYLCYRIAHETGAFVVNVNHPLGPEVTFPEPLRCLVEAFNWVIKNAEKYNLDTNKMLVTGDSSGAYYAAMLCVTQDNEKLQSLYGKMNGRFSFAAYNCGLYDLNMSLSHRLPFGLTTGVCIDISGRKPKDLASWEYMPYCSPIDFVTEKHPASYVVYAKKDFFCKGQAETLVEKLHACGVPVSSYNSASFWNNHAFSINNHNKTAKEALCGMLDFMKKSLE